MTDRDDFTQQVRDAIDIVDVVSDQTRLQRRGKRLLGLCPFHKEKTPSFSVDADQGLYYCFGCGAGGDALGFHMQVTGDDFRMTLETMARRYGVAIPEQGQVSRGPNLDGVLAAAADFFVEQLDKSTFAKRYLERRQIGSELHSRFGVGFAPDGWQNLFDALGKRFPPAELEAAGLIGRGESGRAYDRFRNRLMFPIHATSGRLVGFGGRTLGDDRAKYVNTAETEAFRKSKILYGLHLARPRIREEGKVLLVEGYFDVLGAVASGVDWVVASMGTAFTEEQSMLLHRYADEVVIGYDGDRAGEEASRKALQILLGGGVSVRRAQFPAGQDPDSLRVEEGPEVVKQVIDDAADAVLLEIDRIPVDVSADPRRAALAAEPVAALLYRVKDQLMRREYAKRAAGRLGVEDDLLLKAPAPKRWADRGQPTTHEVEKPKLKPETDSMEHQVLRLLLAGARPDLPLPAEAFWDEECRLLYRAWTSAVLDEEYGGDVTEAARSLSEGRSLGLLARLRLSATELEETTGATAATGPDEGGAELGGGDALDDEALAQLDDLLATLEQRYVRQENRRIQNALAEAEREGNAEQVMELTTQKMELRRRLHGS